MLAPFIRKGMHLMQRFKKIVDAVDTVTTWGVYLSVTVMVAMVAMQVITRYVFHSSFSFTEELARYMFIWSVALGAALALKERKHVAVTVVVSMLPKNFRRVIRSIADALAVLFFSLLLIFGIVMVISTRMQTTPALGISFAYVYLAIPVSAVILVINGVYNAWSDFTGVEETNGGEE